MTKKDWLSVALITGLFLYAILALLAGTVDAS